MRCLAAVTQVGSDFKCGLQKHIHPPDLKLPLKAEISSKVKKTATDKVFRSASDIIEETVRDTISPNERFLKPNQKLLKRAANRHRANLRPVDPTDLEFTLNQDFLNCEDFLIGDIRVDSSRHLIFSTPLQLQLLKRASRWYMDGTFKVVGAPFKPSGQLMSIHAFVTNEQDRKQFPLVFAIMSRKRKVDYEAVLKAIIDKLENNQTVDSFVLDFEKAAWQAIRSLFPDTTIKGCVFHWTQAVWRRVQELGLSRSYREEQGLHVYVRQLLALPFLPHNHILRAFSALKERANTQQLVSLTDYIATQWMTNSVFGVENWPVFKETVRSNNDVEGWHYRLNNKAATSGLGIYKLIPLLRWEAETVETCVISDDLERVTRTRYTKVEEKLQKAWERYTESEISTTQFLKLCSNIYGEVSGDRDSGRTPSSERD